MANDPEVMLDGEATSAEGGRALTWTVKPGESLSSITEKLGRDKSEWPVLYRSARAVLVVAQRMRGELPASGEPDPNKLYSGLVLPLPAEWSAASPGGGPSTGDDVFLSPRIIAAGVFGIVALWFIVSALTKPAGAVDGNSPLASIR